MNITSSLLALLGPLGSCVAALRFTLAWAASLLAGVIVLVECVTVGPLRAWLWTHKIWAETCLRLVGVSYAVSGTEHLQGPAVFVSNHQSMLDVVLLPRVLPRKVRIVAKKELGRIPLWGWALAASAAIMIDRRDRSGAIESIRTALKRLPRGWSVAVFPEGTRSKDGELQAFKKGAFHIAMQAGLPMVPIGLDGGQHLVPKGHKLVRPGRIEVTVGTPINTDAWRAETIDQHVEEVRAAVAACSQRSRQRLHVLRRAGSCGAAQSTAATTL